MALPLPFLHVVVTVRQRSIIPLGDRALTVDLSDVGGAQTRDAIRALVARARTDAPPGVTGIVPAIRTLTVHYDPAHTSFDALADYMDDCVATLVFTTDPARDPVVIPVCYGGSFGPDLDDVAAAHDTTPEAIVAAHVAGEYTVAMIGFLPGFPYLDGLAESLHTPRRAAPRTHVPAGSIGIGGNSTGIYPFTSPGGWHLIGRTPRIMFSPLRDPPSLLQAGDVVKFSSISERAFDALLERR